MGASPGAPLLVFIILVQGWHWVWDAEDPQDMFMNEWIDEWRDGWMGGSVEGWVDGWID